MLNPLKLLKSCSRVFLLLIFLSLLWQSVIWLGDVPKYFLPSPLTVVELLFKRADLLLYAAEVTLLEAFLGSVVAFFFATTSALLFFRYRALGFLFWPVLLISQALPTLAIAPLLVLWLGYGVTSKIILVAIMLFFPMASAFLDGLKSTNPQWLEVAHLMTDRSWAILWRIQIPAALPYLASGLRIAAAGALMGAVIGEWIGATQGLGFLLLEANGRFETDLVFAVILVLIILSLLFYWIVNWAVGRLISW